MDENERISQNILNNSMRVATLGIQTLQTLSSIVLSSTRALNKDPVWNAINKEIEAGNTSHVFCDKRDMSAIDQRLKEAGIVTVTGTFNGAGLIIVVGNHAKEAQSILDDYMVQKESFITKEMLDSHTNGNNLCFRVNDLETAMAIQKRCQLNHIPLVLDDSSDGGIRIVYGKGDSAVMERIKQDVSIDLCGKSGEILRPLYQFENQNQLNIIDIATNIPGNGISYEHEKDTIVDMNGTEIALNRRGMELKAQGQEALFINRKNTGKIIYSITSMDNPTLLSAKQYQKYIKLESDQEKRSFLFEIQKEQGRPEISKENMEYLSKMEASKLLLHEKLNLEYPVETVEDLSVYNDQQPIQIFEEKGDRNARFSHDVDEAHFPDRHLLNPEEIDFIKDLALNEYAKMESEELKLSLTDEAEAELLLEGRLEDIDITEVTQEEQEVSLDVIEQEVSE